MQRETTASQAQRIIAEDLVRLGWSEVELLARRKGDPAKMALATRLRRETTLTVKAIAGRLHLGTSKCANKRLHSWMQNQRPPSSTEGRHEK